MCERNKTSDLTEKDFKIAIINMCTELKGNMVKNIKEVCIK